MLKQISKTAWRILTPNERIVMNKTGYFAGSLLDLKDGFIHMSPKHAVKTTLDRHFINQPSIILLQIDLSHLNPENVKWESGISRPDILFPHLYHDPLPLSAVKFSYSLVSDGKQFIGLDTILSRY